MGPLQSIEFLHYTTKLGRELLRQRTPPLQLALMKWPNILPDNFRFRWSNVWAKERDRKEAGFIWQIWHKAVAVNVWRGVISRNIDRNCPCCDLGMEESIIHCFWTCQMARQAWESVDELICLIGVECNVGPALSWDQAIFSTPPPRRFQKFARFWSLFRGVTLWSIWIARNDLVFNHIRWHHNKIMSTIWQGFIDYGRGDWNKTRAQIAKKPASAANVLARFDEKWGDYDVICTRNDMRVSWVLSIPTGIG
jgi:hypothetical protein